MTAGRRQYSLLGIDRTDDFTALSARFALDGWELQGLLEEAYNKGVEAGITIGQARTAAQRDGYRFTMDGAINVARMATDVP